MLSQKKAVFEGQIPLYFTFEVRNSKFYYTIFNLIILYLICFAIYNLIMEWITWLGHKQYG